MTYLGNISLLEQPKHGFLCSRTTKSTAILPCLDWAVEMSHGTTPIMSTFHSEMESAVLDMLLRGTCPLIIVLGRSLYKKIPERLQSAYDAGRILFVSVANQGRIDRRSATLCNQFICDNAAHITVGFLSPDSSLNDLIQDALQSGKEVNTLSSIK